MLPWVDYGLIDTDISSDVMSADTMSFDNVLQVLSGQILVHTSSLMLVISYIYLSVHYH